MCDSYGHADSSELALASTGIHGIPARDRLRVGSLVCEVPAVYRPRHPEQSAFYQLLDEHFERYLSVYEERYEQRSGPLRPIVKKTVYAYLDCGRLENGFARIRCSQCKGEHLLAFSCQTRNFCPSCQAKRAALLSERLQEEILASVPHRHVIFTIPKVLRGLMQRERRLLSVLARCAYRASLSVYATMTDGSRGRVGMVASIQTFGAFANWNAHIHAICTDGLLHEGGGFTKLPCPDTALLEEAFRRLVIFELNKLDRLSDAFMASLLRWRHSGFSVYARQVLDEKEPERTAHIARYLVRPPIPQGKVSISDRGMAVFETPPDSRSGETSITFDPVDWVHAVCTQSPLTSNSTPAHAPLLCRCSTSRIRVQGPAPRALLRGVCQSRAQAIHCRQSVFRQSISIGSRSQ